jgi:hypothetical protein
MFALDIDKLVAILSRSQIPALTKMGLLQELIDNNDSMLSSSHVLIILLKNSNENFSQVYEEALNGDVLTIKDTEMIDQLANIIKCQSISTLNIITILKASGARADTYKQFGKFMYYFCLAMGMDDTQVLACIEDGE